MLILLLSSLLGPLNDTVSTATLHLTTMDQQYLLAPKVILASEKTPESDQIIHINPLKTYQEMDGFGFTLTGGSAMHLSKMEKVSRQKLLKELFGVIFD